MSHECHAHDCPKSVPPTMFMCRPHWRRLSKGLKSAIWREYSPGQERRKDPSLRYLAVQQLATGSLEFRANDEDAARVYGSYLLRAMMFAAKAIEAGDGNPLDGLLPPGTEVPPYSVLVEFAAKA